MLWPRRLPRPGAGLWPQRLQRRGMRQWRVRLRRRPYRGIGLCAPRVPRRRPVFRFVNVWSRGSFSCNLLLVSTDICGRIFKRILPFLSRAGRAAGMILIPLFASSLPPTHSLQDTACATASWVSACATRATSAKTATSTSARSTAPARPASLCLTLTITTLPPWWACRSGRISIADQQTRCFRASAEITAASSSRACCDPQNRDGALLCKAWPPMGTMMLRCSAMLRSLSAGHVDLLFSRPHSSTLIAHTAVPPPSLKVQVPLRLRRRYLCHLPQWHHHHQQRPHSAAGQHRLPPQV